VSVLIYDIVLKTALRSSGLLWRRRSRWFLEILPSAGTRSKLTGERHTQQLATVLLLVSTPCKNGRIANILILKQSNIKIFGEDTLFI